MSRNILTIQNDSMCRASDATQGELMCKIKEVAQKASNSQPDSDPIFSKSCDVSEGGIPSANGLKFSETKGASYIAYTGEKGQIYIFPDGKQWEVIDVKEGDWGFRAVALKPIDPFDSRVVLAFAGTGTDPFSLRDLITDGYQALGYGTPSQYKQAAALANDYKNLFGDRLILTGHSLGGGLANYASMMNGDIPSTGLNPAQLVGITHLNAMLNSPSKVGTTVQYNARYEFVHNYPIKIINVDKKIEVPGSGEGISVIFTRHMTKNTAPDVPLPYREPAQLEQERIEQKRIEQERETARKKEYIDRGMVPPEPVPIPDQSKENVQRNQQERQRAN